ncbi:hypothetical protein [Acrocarpospora pleiomorpha]|uniref:hypothetical protein n=1 Tax=Acrocarpospora pleiomorpha TaxID=90975 RepID=UPI0012D2AF23|nr:hypothetical protein [Acrocarpospora pleiomorpha]
MATDLEKTSATAAGGRKAKPPGWLFLLSTVFVTLICFYLDSVPYPYFEGGVFGILAWSALGLIFAIRLFNASPSEGLAEAIPPLLVLVIFMGCLLVTSTDAPFRVRFKLSEQSLEKYAMDLARSGAKTGCQRVGLYYVCGTYSSRYGLVSGGAEAIPGGAQVMVTDWPLMVSRGFLWLPDKRQPPDEVWCEEYKHLSGPWWACRSWDGV